MLTFSDKTFHALQAPFRERWIGECVDVLAARPEVQTLAQRERIAVFAGAAYDWSADAGMSESEAIARLAYLSLLTTPGDSLPINPLDLMGLPHNAEAVLALEQGLAAALCDD